MARITLSLPDELLVLVRKEMPRVNISALLRERLVVLLQCEHQELACVRCAAPLPRRDLEDDAMGRLYKDVMWELRVLVDRVGTAEGAARVFKDIAEGHGVTAAAAYPLPRPSRAARNGQAG